MESMNFRLRHQPLKALYQSYLLTSVIVRIPVWFGTSLLPSWRPRPTWGIRRVLLHNLLRLLVESFFQTGLPSLDTSPRATSMLAGYVEVEPIPTSLVVGEIDELASINNVRPERSHGYWYGPVEKSESGGKVIYFFHSPTALFTPTLCNGLRLHTQARVFALEYRLASAAPFPSENPFPAALLDAISGYRYLLSTGIQAQDIIVCGESAGCVLALSLARYLIMHHGTGPLQKNASSDYSVVFYNGYCTSALLGSLPDSHAALNPWISPASKALGVSSGLFKGFPKTCIVAGEAECRVDTIHVLRDRLIEDIGSDNLTYMEIYGVTHCFCSIGVFDPERSEALRGVGNWEVRIQLRR
ncbi:Alpha/Beta hydrolase protein [Armillaria luteobubalina]|uniref:Alpha/Beta hydrolase protein n=1 Tax=Armillaria luteobubalina TaxID=153913 RepID=A0AA39UQQ1_9AGAR|nr:Alpha/Beta hydrolase protein [Armillaria luteobubalina]